MRRALLAGLVLALATAAPATAAPTPSRPLAVDVAPSPLDAPLRDRVIRSASAASLSAESRARGRYLRAPDGTRVWVRVSPRYGGAPPISPQSMVDFLGRLPHGRELGRLKLMILTPAEISRECSPQAQACYTLPSHVLRVPGEEQQGQFPVAFVLAHEYGHHVAAFRANPPFAPTLIWGPKRWGSRLDVCAKTARGLLFPGDEGDNYEANPGEGWAETYAFAYFASRGITGLPWVYSPLLRPSGGAFAAAIADARSPWRGPTSRAVRLAFGPGRAATRRVARATPLDGWASVRVQAPRGLALRLRVLAGRRVIAPVRERSLARFLICGPRSVELRVTRLGGRGTARVVFRRP